LAQRNPLNEFLEFINLINTRESLLEENVMLHIRARGLRDTNRSTIMKVILLGTPFRLIIDLLMLPFILFQQFLSITISLIIVITSWYIYQFSVSYCIVLFFILLAFLNVKSFSDYLKCIVFDLGDIISYGSFTKFWLKIYFSQTNLHKTWMSEVSPCLSSHIFSSRQLWGIHPMKSEGDRFFNNILSLKNNPEEIKILVDQYWEK